MPRVVRKRPRPKGRAPVAGDVAKRQKSAHTSSVGKKSRLQVIYSKVLGALPEALERSILDAVDPVMELATERLDEIFSKIFSADTAAFEYCQACLALSQHGYHIDHITIYTGSASIECSIYTAHLMAALGDRIHCTFDPEIFSSSFQLRCHIQRMSMRRVCSCYCRGYDTPQPIRADMFDLVCDGGGLRAWDQWDRPISASRTSMALTNKVYNARGWKRLDANWPVSITGVTESSFYSFLTRVVVIVLQDTDTPGAPHRDDGARAFVRSKAAAAAGRRTQNEFESKHGAHDCIHIVDRYHRGERDRVGGVKFMRECCGL